MAIPWSAWKTTEHMENFDPNVVNPHYLNNVMGLAKTHEVIASEDIFDAKGIKLIAKGTKVNDSMQERLIRFKLNKPLESSLNVEGGANSQKLLEQAQSVLDEVTPLSLLMKQDASSKAVLAVLREVRFDKASTLLLSMEQSGNGTGFRHAVLAAVTGVTLGLRLNLDSSALHNIALAGLLHDAGELYINPEFRNPSRQLTPEEWKHIAAHPRIGQLVTESTPGIPRAVSIAIGEHHERPNGFGYPRRMISPDISKLGKILLMTELLCGIFPKQDQPMERSCLAVKVIPGEYPSDLVSLLTGSVHDESSSALIDAARHQELIERVKRIEPRMEAAIAHIETAPPGSSDAVDTLMGQTRERLLMLRRAMYSTGLYGCKDLQNHETQTSGIALEMDTVTYEIEWRLRELSRQITLSMSSFAKEDQREYFGTLVACLI
jgi:hypothetical protein